MIKKNNLGFSFIELLIGLSMSVIIFIVATNLVINFLTINNKSKRRQDIEQTKSEISHVLSDDLNWGSTIVVSPNSIKIDSTIYSLDNFSLKKNGVSITPSNVKVTSFNTTQFTDTTSGTSQNSYKITITLEHLESSSIVDTVSIFSSQRLSSI